MQLLVFRPNDNTAHEFSKYFFEKMYSGLFFTIRQIFPHLVCNTKQHFNHYAIMPLDCTFICVSLTPEAWMLSHVSDPPDPVELAGNHCVCTARAWSWNVHGFMTRLFVLMTVLILVLYTSNYLSNSFPCCSNALQLGYKSNVSSCSIDAHVPTEKKKKNAAHPSPGAR